MQYLDCLILSSILMIIYATPGRREGSLPEDTLDEHKGSSSLNEEPKPSFYDLKLPYVTTMPLDLPADPQIP